MRRQGTNQDVAATKMQGVLRTLNAIPNTITPVKLGAGKVMQRTIGSTLVAVSTNYLKG